MELFPTKGKRSRILIRLTILFTAIYVAACSFLYFRQSYLIFIPTTAIEDTPNSYGCKFEDVRLSGDNSTLTGWLLPAQDPKAAGQVNHMSLIYFHGNAGSIGANSEHSCRLSKYGFNVLIVDYRGFGNSVEGPPTEKKAYADNEIAYQYLLKRMAVTPQQTVIYGHSLGGAMAVELASHHTDAARLIVESSFTSVLDEAETQAQYRIFPLRLLVHEKFDTIHKLPNIKIPILFIHGDADEIIPVHMAHANFNAATGSKSLLIIHNGKHVNGASIDPERYQNAVVLFSVTGKAPHKV